MLRNYAIALGLLILIGCNPNRREPETFSFPSTPSFNADSAYKHIQTQVTFGPRIPGTDGHRLCGDYLVNELTESGFEVTEQVDTVVGYNQKRFPLRNIIGSFDAAKRHRVMLCAHWDSGPLADRDKERPNEPMLGANDNASGVGVLLEVARLIGLQSPNIGVDIVFFDLEDQGRPAGDTETDFNDHGYCLGSKYWSQNVGDYMASYAILLDMVGAEDAEFSMEAISSGYALSTLEYVWDIANQLGHSERFRYNLTEQVHDDHMYVNQIARIPCIDIIHHDSNSDTRFWRKWHTHFDDMSSIDIKSLHAVGETITHAIYYEQEKQ